MFSSRIIRSLMGDGAEICLGARSSPPVDRVTFAFWAIHSGFEAVPGLEVPNISRSPAFEMGFLSDIDLDSWKPPPFPHSNRNSEPQERARTHGCTEGDGCRNDSRVFWRDPLKIWRASHGTSVRGRIGILDPSTGRYLSSRCGLWPQSSTMLLLRGGHGSRIGSWNQGTS